MSPQTERGISMIKHTLKERLIFKYKWEEHPSRVDGHVEVHERCAMKLWVMIAILPLLIVLSPVIVIITWFKITPNFVKFPTDEWEIYTIKKDPDGIA